MTRTGVRGLFQSSASVCVEMTNGGFQGLCQGMISVMFTQFIHPYRALTIRFSAASRCILSQRRAARIGRFFKCAFSLWYLFTFSLFLQPPVSLRKVH